MTGNENKPPPQQQQQAPQEGNGENTPGNEQEVPVDTPEETPAEWPTPREDPEQVTQPPAGECPCYVRVRFIGVGGASIAGAVSWLSKLVIDNPNERRLYHMALETQYLKNGVCTRSVIEMQSAVSEEDASKVGQVATGKFGGVGSGSSSGSGTIPSGTAGSSTASGSASSAASIVGDAYGIRRWDSGKIVDGDDPDYAWGGRQILTTDCATVERLYNLVPDVPTTDYSDAWTCNSVVGWLLEKSGIMDIEGLEIQQPPDALPWGFQQGVTAAEAAGNQ